MYRKTKMRYRVKGVIKLDHSFMHASLRDKNDKIMLTRLKEKYGIKNSIMGDEEVIRIYNINNSKI